MERQHCLWYCFNQSVCFNFQIENQDLETETDTVNGDPTDSWDAMDVESEDIEMEACNTPLLLEEHMSKEEHFVSCTIILVKLVPTRWNILTRRYKHVFLKSTFKMHLHKHQLNTVKCLFKQLKVSMKSIEIQVIRPDLAFEDKANDATGTMFRGGGGGYLVYVVSSDMPDFSECIYWLEKRILLQLQIIVHVHPLYMFLLKLLTCYIISVVFH